MVQNEGQPPHRQPPAEGRQGVHDVAGVGGGVVEVVDLLAHRQGQHQAAGPGQAQGQGFAVPSR